MGECPQIVYKYLVDDTRDLCLHQGRECLESCFHFINDDHIYDTTSRRPTVHRRPHQSLPERPLHCKLDSGLVNVSSVRKLLDPSPPPRSVPCLTPPTRPPVQVYADLFSAPAHPPLLQSLYSCPPRRSVSFLYPKGTQFGLWNLSNLDPPLH